MKSVYIAPINWSAKFEAVSGSYYDYVTEIFLGSEAVYLRVCMYLRVKGWRMIFPKDPMLVIFKLDNSIIRCWRMYDR